MATASANLVAMAVGANRSSVQGRPWLIQTLRIPALIATEMSLSALSPMNHAPSRVVADALGGDVDEAPVRFAAPFDLRHANAIDEWFKTCSVDLSELRLITVCDDRDRPALHPCSL
jgi:hypothetical protein